MLLLSLLTLSGCAELDKIAGLTNPIVLEGLLLGVAEPEQADFDLSGTDFDKGSALAVMLADAASADDLAEAPVGGAAVSLMSSATGRLDLHDGGDGTYTADGSTGLVYQEGDDATLTTSFEGEESSIGMRLPPRPDLSMPANIEPGRDFTIDLSGQAFDNALVVVINTATGATTFDNHPDSIEDIYALTHGEGSLVIDVPGSAVDQESVYLIGVAGLKNADMSAVENANTILSAFMAGQVTFAAASTVPP